MAQQSYSQNCPEEIQPLENLTSIANVRDKIEEPPFIVACKEPADLLKDRPKTGLFVRSVIEKDGQGRKTRDLLKKIITKVRKRVTDAANQIQNIKECMSQPTPQCAELKHWVDVDLPQYVKESRYHLSLSQSQHEVKTWVSIASKKVNENLDSLGSYKYNDWAALTDEEKTRANAQLSTYNMQINKEAKIQNRFCSKCITRFSEEALLAVRFQHYQTYHQMLAELPLMQYLKGPSVNKSELASAFEKMKEDLDHENHQLDEYERMLTASGPLNADVLKILNYSSQLEETLLEDYRDCGLASSLVYTMSNRQMGNAFGIGLPILAVSFFAAPVVIAVGGTAALGATLGIGTGVAAGGAFTLKSFSEFRDTQKRTLGYIYGDALGADLNGLESAIKQTKYDAVTLPVGFGLGGMAIRSLSVGAKSLITGRKIFEKAN